MSTHADLTIPLSALDFRSASSASAMAENWDAVQVGVLLQTVIESHAYSVLDEGDLQIVSVTFDASADAISDQSLVFSSRIDRKTRTLVFASGLARQADRHILKATVVFRIA